MKIVADQAIPFFNDFFSAEKDDILLKPGRAITQQDVRSADALIVRSITRVDEALLSGSAVKFVGSITAGHDHLALAWLAKQAIEVAIAKGFNAPPVADYVMAVLAALEHNQRRAFNTIKRAAIIGVGAIGHLVAAKLQQFGIEVLLCDPYRARNEADFPHTPIEAISDVDLISVHVPLTTAQTVTFPTFHLINEDFLKRQKPNTVVLNASRGAVVDPSTLLQSIRAGELIIALDVWENEPFINTDLLKALTIITPHIAGYSVESKLRGVKQIYSAYCKVFGRTSTNSWMERDKEKPLVLDQPLANRVKLTWNDLVLSVFDPWQVSEALKREWLQFQTQDKEVLLPKYFDQLRAGFNQRHEFSAIQIEPHTLARVSDKDIQRLARLGFNVKK